MREIGVNQPQETDENSEHKGNPFASTLRESTVEKIPIQVRWLIVANFDADLPEMTPFIFLHEALQIRMTCLEVVLGDEDTLVSHMKPVHWSLPDEMFDLNKVKIQIDCVHEATRTLRNLQIWRPELQSPLRSQSCREGGDQSSPRS